MADLGILEWTREPRVLILDDEEVNVRLLSRILARAGLESIVTTTDPFQSLAAFRSFEPDLVLLDLHMPGLDGFDVLASLSQLVADDDYLPILILTGDTDSSAKQRALTMGAKDFLAKPFDIEEIVLRIRNLLRTRLLHLRLREQSATLACMVADRTRELEEARHELLERLALAAELRDDATGQHTQRVSRLAAAIAAALGLDQSTIALIRRAAPLHDIGKIGIPDRILLKPNALTAEERETMRAHTTIGARILAGGSSDVLCTAAEIAHAHHERWDGAGYPRCLIGEAIPLVARIVAAADVVDALSFDRPYRRALPVEEVSAELARMSGSQLDPRVVAALRTLDWPAILGRRVTAAA